MNDRHLARKLFRIVLIKLAILFALWWTFFSEQHVSVDPEAIVGTKQATTEEAPHGQ